LKKKNKILQKKKTSPQFTLKYNLFRNIKLKKKKKYFYFLSKLNKKYKLFKKTKNILFDKKLKIKLFQNRLIYSRAKNIVMSSIKNDLIKISYKKIFNINNFL
jgi:hypothetical protein